MKSGSCSMEEVHLSDGLFNKLTSFNGFVGMLLVGFKNEMISLLRKMDT